MLPNFFEDTRAYLALFVLGSCSFCMASTPKRPLARRMLNFPCLILKMKLSVPKSRYCVELEYSSPELQMIVGRCGIGMDGWLNGGFACRPAAADRLKGAEARACVRGRQRRPIFCPGNKLRQSERVRFPRWSLKMQLTKKPQPQV